ncbi:MAG: hypothetical protein HND47_16805 [Chloroflexi bacterium]|nr:hypothetical protein [Chloroflexota bacterium]
MNELINLIRDNFSAFVEAMLFMPSELQIWHWYEAAVLAVILALAVGVIFLCDWLMKKYKTGFPSSVLLAFLVLSLPIILTGFLLSILRLDLISSDPFLVVGIGSPVFNLVLGVMASLGNRLRKNHRITGTILLLGTGFLFAWVLFTTFILFVLRLVIS